MVLVATAFLYKKGQTGILQKPLKKDHTTLHTLLHVNYTIIIHQQHLQRIRHVKVLPFFCRQESRDVNFCFSPQAAHYGSAYIRVSGLIVLLIRSDCLRVYFEIHTSQLMWPDLPSLPSLIFFQEQIVQQTNAKPLKAQIIYLEQKNLGENKCPKK